MANLVPIYIALIGAACTASAIWRYVRRDYFGMTASVIIASSAAAAMLR